LNRFIPFSQQLSKSNNFCSPGLAEIEAAFWNEIYDPTPNHQNSNNLALMAGGMIRHTGLPGRGFLLIIENQGKISICLFNQMQQEIVQAA
jgi:hypothetical protein